MEEALIEMYLAGVSVRRVEDVAEALWDSKASPATISELNKKACVRIEDWRNRPLQGGRYPYVYVDGICLRRNWGGECKMSPCEGMEENKAKLGQLASAAPWPRFGRRKAHHERQVHGDAGGRGRSIPRCQIPALHRAFLPQCFFSVVPRSKVKMVAKMLKAIRAQESKKASRKKARAVVAELKTMKLKEAVKKVEDGIEETLACCDFAQRVLDAYPHEQCDRTAEP